MTYDQANHLRRLVSRCAAPEAAASRPRPDLAVVTSGKGGVGTTTIAVNLAAAVAQQGVRTVLVDADPDGGDVALLCALEERHTLADVLAGRRTVGEVLQPGPGGLCVLPGLWGWEARPDCPPAACKRFPGQLEGLGGQADLVVVDAGNRPHRMMPWFWQSADRILVVTTAESPAILGTYASIKALAEQGHGRPIHLLVNLAPDAAVAASVRARLAQACHRFLAVDLQDAGHLPLDPAVPAAQQAGQPFVLTAPDGSATRHVGRLAQTLATPVTADPPTPGRPQKPGKTAETIQPQAAFSR